MYQFYPTPNLKEQTTSPGKLRQPGEPAIEGHVHLKMMSERSVKIDSAMGSVGFLADRKDYLQVHDMQVFDFPSQKQMLRSVSGWTLAIKNQE